MVLEARERKRAEKALRESEERWQLVLRGNNDGIWDWNIKTNEAFISPRWKEMLGYEDHEIENHHNEWISRVHPDDLDWIMEALQAHLDRKTPYSFSEYRLRCKDGSYKWILSRGQALWDEEGKPVRMVGSNTDITERKQREEALRLIVEGTAAKTGSDFFRSCTRYLAQVLQVRYALITKFANKEKTRVCTLAFWQGKDFGNNFEYDLASTSSEAIDGTKCYYSESTQALFRKDPDLAKLNAQSYLGIPLVDSSGNVLGYLAVLDSAPIIKDPGKELILKIFAARAGAELERKIAEEALQQQAEKDSLLSSISRQFIDQDIDTAINFTLQALGEFTGSDRSYIIRYSDCQSLLSATHSWCDDGIVPCMENYQEFSVETFPWFSEQLMGGNPVNISLVADLPLEAATEKAKLENDATKSLLIVPMINADKTVGYLGLDAVRSPKVWTHEDIGLLKLVGEFIAIAQARHQAEEALRESQARFAGILDNANEAIISVDETQRITLFNYGAEQTFGYTSSEVLGQPLDLLLPTRFAEIHSQHIADFDQASKTARKMGGGRPVFGRRKDGTEFMAEVSISKLDLGGRKVFTAIVRDITERKQAEEALQKAKEAADAANRAKSEFLASMSHELRTPLNAILGFTQVMNRDLSLSTEQQQNLGIISRSGEHLLELINDILEMSKIEAGRTTFNKSSFDLYRLVDNLEEMLRLKADAKSLQLIFERTSEVPQYVQTDEGKLRQVLINLLGNAIKFTEEGGVTLRVGMGHESFVKDKEHLTIHLEIEDTGPGIAPEEVDKLFAAFGQTETGRKSQQGTGLGLPISKKFVQLMGGDITVSSILDRGTVFAFDIQVSLADASEIQTIQPRRKVIGLAPDQPKYRILVVDDRLESRLLLLKLLASMGFSVREAANGQEAIDLWSSWEPHLIWMDMRMPVIDGYEATKYIKATTKGQATVIIALTASAFEEDRAVVLSAGCNDFMRKPFREEVLWEKMAQHLGVRYIYEEPESNAQSHRARERAKSPLDQPLDFHLSQMPSEWIQQLQQAAAECSDDLILELIEQIPEENAPLAIALKDLAENFLFDKLIEVTQLR
ncbi:MAG: PAS domain S-box protein [Xenococcaceae cyanobacterium]